MPLDFDLGRPAATLPGTEPLTEEGDLAAGMVAGLHRFLDRALGEAEEARRRSPLLAPPSAEALAQAAEAARQRLAKVLGVVDTRLPVPALELVGTTQRPARVGQGQGYSVYAVRWPVLEGLEGEGLLLQPDGPPVAHVVALPDADWTPEQLVGLVPGLPPAAQYGRRLAELGCQVVIPALIDRRETWSGNPAIRMTNQPHREFLYRMGFPLGRHLIGLEVQKILAVVDWFTAQGSNGGGPLPVGLFGYGEGGLLALCGAALDRRVAAVGVSGHLRNRAGVWQEPIYRNVWGLLRGLSDAELAALVAPRGLVVEAVPGPVVEGPPPERPGRAGAAPGRLAPAPLAEVQEEVALARAAFAACGVPERLVLVEPEAGDGGVTPGSAAALQAWLGLLGVEGRRPGQSEAPGAGGAGGEEGAGAGLGGASAGGEAGAEAGRLAALAAAEAEARQHRQFVQMCEFLQEAMRRSARRRAAFWAQAETASVAAWAESCRPYRDYLWDEVIGRAPAASLPPRPRTRLAEEAEAWLAYEVVLDIWPDVFAYGLLLLPRDLAPGERRPVVVCQHGLEGRPQDTIRPEPASPYQAFAARLAERGYVVFAPQNPYIGRDAFRTLQRKANPLGWSLFTFITAQHQRILEWLAGLPCVDSDRIAFYGLSYGGKTAIRVPALLSGYCLSICSGDFNEWVVKLVSTDLPMSYMFTGEYEIFEFDLANTFNYAELAGLIAPRPFMVERGHHDGVGLDEWVAFEYAKVRRLYADLGIPERTRIAFFQGGHRIDGTETFAFLDRYLRG